MDAPGWKYMYLSWDVAYITHPTRFDLDCISADEQPQNTKIYGTPRLVHLSASGHRDPGPA